MSLLMKTHTLLLIGGIVCIVVISCRPSGTQTTCRELQTAPSEGQVETNPQKRQVIVAAGAAVRRHGYDPKEFRIIYDEGNATWKSRGPIPDRRLDGHDFQLITYMPRAEQSGGELWVFVDKNTGEELRFIVLQ